MKRRSPCAECDHHRFGLPKNCEKCEKCEKRQRYVDEVEEGDIVQRRGYNERAEHSIDPTLNRNFVTFGFRAAYG